MVSQHDGLFTTRSRLQASGISYGRYEISLNAEFTSGTSGDTQAYLNGMCSAQAPVEYEIEKGDGVPSGPTYT